MTSLVTAQYDSNKNQVLDPNSRGVPAVWTDSTGTALVSPSTGLPVSLGGTSSYADTFLDAVISGLVLPSTGTLGVAAITAGVAYASGARVATISTIPTLTASKDNYVDLSSLGVFTVSPVTIAASAPAVAANSIRLGYITTGASTITSATMTGKDTLGNWLRNTVKQPTCMLRYSAGPISGTISFPANTEQFDNNQMHSGSVNPSRITISLPGLYLVQGAVNDTAGGLNTLVINKNGADAQLFADTQANATTIISSLCGGFLPLVAGDYLEINLAQSVTTNVIYFSATRIS